MKKTIIFLIIFILLLIQYSVAQNETDKWFFGDKVGLDFSGGNNPTVLSGFFTFDACPGMYYESTEDVGIFCDGTVIYDFGGANIGNVLLGNSITQPAIIVKSPYWDTLYYIITVPQPDGTAVDNLYYTKVGRNLGSNTFEIISLSHNIELVTNSCAKIAIVKHNNGEDYWIITHQQNSNDFTSYLLTESGISNPQISTVGPSYGDYLSMDYLTGFFKASPTGTYLASSSVDNAKIYLYNFNNETGELTEHSNYDINYPWGIEFSPNEEYLYIGQNGTGANEIYQIDIATQETNVIGSVGISVFVGALQLGKNGKIYVAKKGIIVNERYLGVINAPNEFYTSCNYNNEAIDFGVVKNINLSLPSFCASYIKSLDFTQTSGGCAGELSIFNISYINGIDSVLWEFDDYPNENDTSTSFNPEYTFWSGGLHEVSLSAWYANIPTTIIKQIDITGPQINLGDDLSACDTITIYPTFGIWTPPWSFSWTNETTGQTGSDSAFFVNNIGENYIWINATDNTGCTAHDEIVVNIEEGIEIDLGSADTTMCQGGSIVLNIGNGDFENISWSTADCDNEPTCEVFNTGFYWVEVWEHAEGCHAKDSIYVFELHCQDFFPEIILNNTYTVTNDTIVICSENNTINLKAEVDFPYNNLCYGQSAVLIAWDLGDGNIMEVSEINYTYEEPGEYLIHLRVEDERGCSKVVGTTLYLSNRPDLEKTEKSFCINETTDIKAGYLPNSDIILQPMPYTFPFKKYLFHNSPEPISAINTYSSTITISGFEAGDIITAPEDILSFTIRMEHSNLADISEIILISPDGNEHILMDIDDEDLIPAPTIMGQPILFDETDMIAGEPASYYFINEFNSSIEELALNNINFYASYTDPVGQTVNEVFYIPSAIYRSEFNFEELINCSYNGEWKLLINSYGNPHENGFVFNWGIKFRSGILFSNSYMQEYNWTGPDIINDLDSTITISPQQTGNNIYNCTFINEINCEYSENYTIFVDSLWLELGNDTSLCEGQTVTLFAGEQGNNYSWSTGENTNEIIVTEENIYWVEASNENCIISDTIMVSFFPAFIVDLGDDVTILPNESVTLDAGLFENATYFWQPTAETTQTITVSDTGIYIVTVTKQCSVNDSVNVKTIVIDEKELIVPNAFTPNGDGVNDTWKFGKLENFNNINVQIFNKSGNIISIYDTKDNPQGWDGTNKNMNMPSDTYWYVIRFENGRSSSGSVTIKR